MSEQPTIDGRRREEIQESIEAIVPTYTDSWVPGAGDPGDALVELGAAMGGDVMERLDQLPAKHRAAFFETLGFDRRPPQSARAPVMFTLVEDLTENVAIPSGTELAAEGEEEDIRFRLLAGDDFEATPARLRSLVSVDPSRDHFSRHEGLVENEQPETLFLEANEQAHSLYIGHDDRLAISGPATILLNIESSAADLADLVWEYYGTDETVDAAEPTWHELTPTARGSNHLEFAVTEDQELLETAPNGIDSSWLRGSLPPDSEPSDFAIMVESVTFASAPNSARVGGLFAHDVPQPLIEDESDESVYPFGSMPRVRDTFYIASEEGFTKAGAKVTLDFVNLAVDQASEAETVRLSWEYFDGDAWQVLTVSSPSAPDDFPSWVSFSAPKDIAATTVAGKDGVWIRTRIVAGEFVIRDYEVDGDNISYEVDGEPPSFDAVEVSYEYGDAVDDSPMQLLTKNNGSFDRAVSSNASFRPFRPLPEPSQTVYFGFDGPLRDGPIQFLLAIAEERYPAAFDPLIRWEYCSDGAANEWSRIAVGDETRGLTEAGIVSAQFPEETTAFERFGTTRHWIRARIRASTFSVNEPADDATDEATVPSPADTEYGCAPGEHRERCRPILGAVGAAAADSTPPPTVQGVYVNTGRVENVRVVEDELLGSSEGLPGETVSVERPPIVDSELWVDEQTALSSDDRAELKETEPSRIDIERAANGEIVAVWVKWVETENLFTRASADRVYEVDAVTGTVTFGNGSTGRIPPHGEDNIRATYRTGGGEAGNVAPGEIEALVTSIGLVDEVSNPVEGMGGSTPESTEAVLDRAPKTLRDRGRAVTAADFERIANDASRQLAAIRCVPGMNRAGEHDPGWVTILIVPDDNRAMPQPSPELRRQVREAVSDRAPLTLIAAKQLVVRGPSYVGVAVDAELVAVSGARLGTVEDRVTDQLEAYLHPLTGDEGTGWSFGELPTYSDINAIIERTPGVDHVRSLGLTYARAGETVEISAGETPPATAADILVRSGTHELTLEPDARTCTEVT